MAKIYQYKVVIYDIKNQHYATLIRFSSLENDDYEPLINEHIKKGAYGIHANRATATRIGVEHIGENQAHYFTEQAQ